MWAWFLKLIGVSPDVLAHLERAELAWQRPTILWLGLAFLVPAAWLIHRRQATHLPTVSPQWRSILTATRVLTLLMLIAILAGPYLKIDHRYERKPILAVLFDRSQSMNLPAGPFESEDERSLVVAALGDTIAADSIDGKTRADIAHCAYTMAQTSWTKELADRFELRYYALGRDAVPLQAPNAGTASMTEEPATQIGSAIEHVIDAAAGQPVSAIVILSDGQSTGGLSPTKAIATAGRSRTSLFTVPIGSRRRLQDVSIIDVYTSSEVAIGDTVRVAVTIESHGFDERSTTVELREGEKTLDVKELTLSSAEQQQLELVFVADEPGLHYLNVFIPSFSEEPEMLRSNNIGVAIVRVSEDKLKLLLIDGLPRWDFRFLKNAVRRDHGLTGATANDVDILLEAEWRRLPTAEQHAARQQAIDALDDYHTVVVGDVSPELLDTEFQQRLIEAVTSDGLGLIVAAGPNDMPHAFDEQFQDLLPVHLQPTTAGVEAPAYKPFRVEVTPGGIIHDAMRLYDDPTRNRYVWSRMPAFYWAAAAERASPAASVLAWNSSIETRFGKMPLVAYHYAGEGRVAFVGTDSTWLWRQNVGDRYFYRFWGQMVRFVARRNDGETKTDSLEVRPLRAHPGEKAEVELYAYHADGSPRTGGRIEITATGPDHTHRVELTSDVASEGRYVGRYTPEGIGEHRLVYQSSPTAQPIEARLEVMPSSVELRDPNVNRPYLDNLAQATGGKLLELNELGDIPTLVSGESQTVEIYREATIWDNWLMLLLLVLVYSFDVGIRRSMGLS